MNLATDVITSGGVVAALAIAMLADPPSRTLAADPLDGTGQAAWRRAPSTFVDAPGGGRAFRCVRGATVDPAALPWIGDETWSVYRVDVEVLLEKNWAGIDFHVRDDGGAASSVTVLQVPGDQLVAEAASLRGLAFSWKTQPVGQRTAPHAAGDWVRLRLDVGRSVANLYIGDTRKAAATFHDLTGGRGGVRLMTYAGSALFRNLRITELSERAVRPLLPDPWAAARTGRVLTDWQVTPAREKRHSASGLPPEVSDGSGPWTVPPADRRGVISLTDAFGDRNTGGVTFARAVLVAPKAGQYRLKVTYTDDFSLWCNGQRVFTGPPRQWFHPEREKHGRSRLIPDQYEVVVSLKAGPNTLVARSEATEPFGWAFWMRLVDTSRPTLPSNPRSIGVRTSVTISEADKARSGTAIRRTGGTGASSWAPMR